MNLAYTGLRLFMEDFFFLCRLVLVVTAQQIKLGPPLVLASGYPFFDLGCGFL